MFNYPIHPKCEAEFRPLRNGVMIEATIRGEPEAKRAADLYACSKCGEELIFGFAPKGKMAFEEGYTSWDVDYSIHYK